MHKYFIHPKYVYTCIRARIIKRTRHNNDVVDVTSIMANNYLASAVRNSFEIGNSEVVWRMTSWIQATVCRLHQTLVNVIHLIKSSKLSRDEWDGQEHIENGKKTFFLWWPAVEKNQSIAHLSTGIAFRVVTMRHLSAFDSDWMQIALVHACSIFNLILVHFQSFYRFYWTRVSASSATMTCKWKV